jgi:hypothetical protein
MYSRNLEWVQEEPLSTQPTFYLQCFSQAQI